MPNSTEDVVTIFDIAKQMISLISTTVITSACKSFFVQKSLGKYDVERYEKVIFPVFDRMETFLYKKCLSAEELHTVSQCRKIVMDNKMIAGGKMLECFLLDEKKEFRRMSRIIDAQFDLYSRKLKIPRRSLDYRLNRTKGVSILNIALFAFRMLGFALAMGSIAVVIFALISKIL